MRYSIRKNWMGSLGLMIKQPLVIMPFIIVAFLEGLALEVSYFATRSPISIVTNPIIGKFFGRQFLHYPGCLLLLPQLFYYLQLTIYVSAGVFLTAISVNIFKNIRAGLPVKVKAMAKNALKNYISFFVYALAVVIVTLLLTKFDKFIFTIFFKILSKIRIHTTAEAFYVGLKLAVFFSYVILQVFILLTIPIMVIYKKGLVRAMLQSIVLGFRNFVTLAALIFLPLFIYLPVTFLKSFSTELVGKTFPEINFYVALVGIVASIFLDCFIIMCGSRFLMDKCNLSEKTA